MACPLCLSADAREVLRKDQPHHGEQLYYHCGQCGLVFVSPEGQLSGAAEKARYDAHNNDAADPKYRAFLQQAIDPLMERLTPEMRGLDFGSGPGPTIRPMLAELGYTVADYDPIYAPDEMLLEEQYDFIISTETVEHFREPRQDWLLLDTLLKSRATLSVMTQRRPELVELAQWWYLNDPTHVALYSSGTMEWIAGWLGWSVEQISNTVTLFKK